MADASSEYTGYRLEIFIGVFTPLQILAVALRFYARSLTASSYGVDDWLCVLSLFSQMVQGGICIAAVIYGGIGYHAAYLEDTSPKTIVVFLKYLVAIATWYFLTMNIAKISICMTYRRLFPQRVVHVILWLVAGSLICSAVASSVASLVSCRPFWTNWGTKAQQAEHCFDKEALYIWSSFPNIVTDVILLVIPLPITWNLHTTFRLKVVLTITFLFGSVGLISSILRFVTFSNNNSFIDPTGAATELCIWTIVEPGIYLISACLLTYRPLLDKWNIVPLASKKAHGPSAGSHGYYGPGKYAMGSSASGGSAGSTRAGKHGPGYPKADFGSGGPRPELYVGYGGGGRWNGGGGGGGERGKLPIGRDSSDQIALRSQGPSGRFDRSLDRDSVDSPFGGRFDGRLDFGQKSIMVTTTIGASWDEAKCEDLQDWPLRKESLGV